MGHDGVAAVARATGLAIRTVRRVATKFARERRPATSSTSAATRSAPFETAHPEVWPALEKLVDQVTRGDPESPLCWTCKT